MPSLKLKYSASCICDYVSSAVLGTRKSLKFKTLLYTIIIIISLLQSTTGHRPPPKVRHKTRTPDVHTIVL